MKGKQIKKNTGPRKTFQKDGRWVVKPNRTEVLVCQCGSKYIKTRDAQTCCVRCMYRRPTPHSAKVS